MARNVARQLIDAHLVGDPAPPGGEIAIHVDQTLTQDATGTFAMLAVEAMGLDRVRTELSVQYVDHNLLQQDFKNADDHLFLHSAAERYGLWFSPPGNGVSHPVHMQCFGVPGKSLLGSDSHTCAAGALGMLAMGAGGLDVALAMAGEPYHLVMPEIWGIELVGELPPWVSAKDVVLELLRRHGVRGALGRILEYHGPGLAGLSAWDRHVIANMGIELGATASVFPSDDVTRDFLAAEGRGDAWTRIEAEPGATWDHDERLDLSSLVPLVARPSSPGNVVPVSEVAGQPIDQAYVGSSANPGFRDFAIAAAMVRGKRIAPQVSFDINPTTRQLLVQLTESGLLTDLLRAGARLHQAGCNGCIGMGQAPGTGRHSIRTVPRNFPGRSGTPDDHVWLASPETVTASALTGVITDPRTLGARAPRIPVSRVRLELDRQVRPPLPPEQAARVELVRGPNIRPLPPFDPLPDELLVPVLLVLGDDVSTDTILPAGSRVLPFRSNLPEISRFAFNLLDDTYPARALNVRPRGGHAIVAGRNYGQGSSREHAAAAPRYLGLRVVLARSFARIHRQNLVNFGVLPLLLDEDPGLVICDVLHLRDLRSLEVGAPVRIEVRGRDAPILARHDLSARELELVKAGGVLPRFATTHPKPAPEVEAAAHHG